MLCIFFVRDARVCLVETVSCKLPNVADTLCITAIMTIRITCCTYSQQEHRTPSKAFTAQHRLAKLDPPDNLPLLNCVRLTSSVFASLLFAFHPDNILILMLGRLAGAARKGPRPSEAEHRNAAEAMLFASDDVAMHSLCGESTG